MISIRDLGVTYRTSSGVKFQAVGRVDLNIPQGEFCVIVGPSGCGKSTVLKVLAGLVRKQRGEIAIGGQQVTGPRTDIGFVFQSPTLLPWMTILGNATLPIRVQRKTGKAARTARGMELLRLIGLDEFAQSYPRELSGGMQQRVGLARALAHDPALLLMDEPFGALDALTREQMNAELQALWTRTGKTVLFVTHSISEAVFLADRVIVMSARPGTIIDTIPVDLPRPRTFDQAEQTQFGDIARRIRRSLMNPGSST